MQPQYESSPELDFFNAFERGENSYVDIIILFFSLDTGCELFAFLFPDTMFLYQNSL